MTIAHQGNRTSREFYFSVIIPTYNRREILEKTLKALEEQTLSKEIFEVIVVNDGSTDDTADFLERYKNRGLLNFTYVSKENEGQGIARNTGFDISDAKILVFLGDDCIPAPNFLEEHQVVHDKYFTENFICLGLTTWSSEIEVTPYMLFLEDIGMQFKYKALENAKLIDYQMQLRMADHRFFYTSNISLKRTLFERQQFHPGFKKYGWEDVELGFRLIQDEGAVILYNPNAKCSHVHHMTVDNMKERMIAVGKSAKRAATINKRLKIRPGILKTIFFALIALPPILLILKKIADKATSTSTKQLPFALKVYYYALMKKWFLVGLHLRKRKKQTGTEE